VHIHLVIRTDTNKVDAFGYTKRMILNLLLDGSKTAGEIADRLHIQKSAVRIHLESLQTEQAVRSYFRIDRLGRGRPKKVYEITESGLELFPREYDAILSLLIQKIEQKEGHEYIKEVIKSIADDMANDIRDRIKKNSASDSFEESLNVLNSFSNELGFMSSVNKEDNIGTYSITSRNCVIHKVALSHQDVICNGLHSRMIERALDGKVNPNVRLKECIALGNNHSRHVIATTTNNNKDKLKP
jgi:DeoR family transcriptional regulator, suf operon transcriptional repressor